MPPPIHIVNPLWNAAGGSEWRALALYESLAPAAETTLWSEFEPAGAFANAHGLRRITPGDEPRGGTLVLVGTYFPLGGWLERAEPDRVIVIHNVVGRALLDRTLARLAVAGLAGAVELVYTSELCRLAGGVPGIVQYSPIDTTRFVPGAASAGEDFVAGRLSRDVPDKHHPEDPLLYRELLAAGIGVDLMGAEVLAPALADHPRLRRRPAGSLDAVVFLQGLDCFVFRTAPDWTEPLGRVVLEAVACGVPVVAHRSGGYCEVLEEGVSALFFDTTARGVEQVLRLRRDPALAARLAARARAAVLALDAPRERERWRRFFAR